MRNRPDCCSASCAPTDCCPGRVVTTVGFDRDDPHADDLPGLKRLGFHFAFAAVFLHKLGAFRRQAEQAFDGGPGDSPFAWATVDMDVEATLMTTPGESGLAYIQDDASLAGWSGVQLRDDADFAALSAGAVIRITRAEVEESFGLTRLDDVTFDVFALCLKTRNACVLKGSSDAHDTNRVVVRLMHEVLLENGILPDCVFLAPPQREWLSRILEAVGLIDLAIPRGSQGLIDFVRDNARIPVIETGAGIVHTYVDASAATAFQEKRKRIVVSAAGMMVELFLAAMALLLACFAPVTAHQDYIPGTEIDQRGAQTGMTLDGDFVHNIGELQMNITNFGVFV